ncbi:hypothetical protein [Halocatena marina]|uniref:Secreted protein n=1 Tax=Halocatena marina TaxID=2934937 RepID=A0ABD5YPW0_9EURY|nr:hypothetical protein [Halocatena marina]
MEPITVLLFVCSGCIVILVGLYSTIALSHYVRGDSHSERQRTPWAANRNGTDSNTNETKQRQRPGQRSIDANETEDETNLSEWQWQSQR